jgi:hypothetical protein
MNALPPAAELKKFFTTSIGALAVQGTTLSAFDRASGRIVYVYVKRNSDSFPLWKPIVLPPVHRWPTSLSGSSLLIGKPNQWLSQVQSPAWSGT